MPERSADMGQRRSAACALGGRLARRAHRLSTFAFASASRHCEKQGATLPQDHHPRRLAPPTGPRPSTTASDAETRAQPGHPPARDEGFACSRSRPRIAAREALTADARATHEFKTRDPLAQPVPRWVALSPPGGSSNPRQLKPAAAQTRGSSNPRQLKPAAAQTRGSSNPTSHGVSSTVFPALRAHDSTNPDRPKHSASPSLLAAIA
jgi:hypothetical protein